MKQTKNVWLVEEYNNCVYDNRQTRTEKDNDRNYEWDKRVNRLKDN